MGKTFLYIGAGVLFIMSLCFLGYGGFAIVGSTSAQGKSDWVTLGAIMSVVGIFLAGGGVGLIWLALRGQKTEVVQQVTMKVDLPGDTSIEQMKCQSCGGAITSNDIKIMAGAPVVTCPYCNSTYQLTEEPKW